MKQKIKTIGYVSPVVFFFGLGLFYINGLWDIYSIGLTSRVTIPPRRKSKSRPTDGGNDDDNGNDD